MFANYAIDPAVLTPLLPKGTKLGLHHGNCYVSLVAFQFLDTKVFGIPAFSNRNFEEINLRFYIKRPISDGKEQSGVAFIKEIVSSRLVAWTARTLYGENYVAMNMSHEIKNNQATRDLKLTYKCGVKELSNKFSATVSPGSQMSGDEVLGPYITEHYWGYSRPEKTTTVEYEVKHPKWTVNQVIEYSIDFDFEGLYGTSFKSLSEIGPSSVFYCNGSNVTVHLGSKIST